MQIFAHFRFETPLYAGKYAAITRSHITATGIPIQSLYTIN